MAPEEIADGFFEVPFAVGIFRGTRKRMILKRTMQFNEIQRDNIAESRIHAYNVQASSKVNSSLVALIA